MVALYWMQIHRLGQKPLKLLFTAISNHSSEVVCKNPSYTVILINKLRWLLSGGRDGWSSWKDSLREAVTCKGSDRRPKCGAGNLRQGIARVRDFTGAAWQQAAGSTGCNVQPCVWSGINHALLGSLNKCYMSLHHDSSILLCEKFCYPYI